jgi:hypothetical protein
MLGVTLQINDRVIAFYEIRRMHPVCRAMQDNTIGTYNVYDDEGNLMIEGIKHRYGDMAEILTAKVLRKIHKLRKASHETR